MKLKSGDNARQPPIQQRSIQALSVKESQNLLLIGNEDRHPIGWSEVRMELPVLPLHDWRVHEIMKQCAWAIQKMYSPLNPAAIESICASLVEGSLKAVSDGSSKDGVAAASWIIICGEVEVSGGFKVPGPADDSDSYRAELGGLLAILTILEAVCSVYHVANGSAEIACGNKGCLWCLFGSDRPGYLTDNQF